MLNNSVDVVDMMIDFVDAGRTMLHARWRKDSAEMAMSVQVRLALGDDKCTCWRINPVSMLIFSIAMWDCVMSLVRSTSAIIYRRVLTSTIPLVTLLKVTVSPNVRLLLSVEAVPVPVVDAR